MITLRISELVCSGTEAYEQYVPASGKKVTISKVIAEGAYSQNSVVKVCWKYGTVNEQPLWTVKGSCELNSPIIIPTEEIDGVNALAIALENGEAGCLYMSGIVEFEVTD